MRISNFTIIIIMMFILIIIVIRLRTIATIIIVLIIIILIMVATTILVQSPGSSPLDQNGMPQASPQPRATSSSLDAIEQLHFCSLNPGCPSIWVTT